MALAAKINLLSSVTMLYISKGVVPQNETGFPEPSPASNHETGAFDAIGWRFSVWSKGAQG
jgi:hypothetical protein